MRAVRVQAAKIFYGVADFVNYNDAQRQRLAEALLVQSALLSSSIEVAKNDPRQIPTLTRLAREAAAPFDLDAWVLTESGFVPVRENSRKK